MKRGSVSRSPARAWMLGAVLAAVAAGCGDSGTEDAASTVPPPQYSPSSSGYVYVASADRQGLSVPGVVYQFQINADLSINPLATPAVPTGVTPTAIVAVPSGRFVYVVSAGDLTISQYAVTSGGALAPLSPASLSISPSLGSVDSYFASVDPAGRFLYVVSEPPAELVPSPQFESYIAQYAIDSSNGTLSLVTTFYAGVLSSSSPLTIDPAGTHAYLVYGAAVLPFTIEADGTLSAMTPVTVAAEATRVVLSPDGHLAYVLSRCIDTNCDGQVELYTVAATGELIPTGATTSLGNHISPVDLLIECAVPPNLPCSGQFAYLLTDSMETDINVTNLFGYAIDANGTLVTDPQIPEATFGGYAVAAGVDGRIYALSGVGSPLDRAQLAVYSPALTALGSLAVAGRTKAMAIVLPRVPVTP
jgi:6-phosphogluconolactonase (cycloisomerase 2 family)